MLVLEQTVIKSREEFKEFTAGMLKIGSIIFSSELPHTSIVFKTDEAKYVDFLRVCQSEIELQLHSEYQIIYALDKIYIYCDWKFTIPVKVDMRFIIDADKFHYAMVRMAEEEFIGIAFSTSSHDDTDGYDVIALESIPKYALFKATLLDTLLTTMRADPSTKTIIAAMVQ